MSFTPFDPLDFKNTKGIDAAFSALKREISNILSSYVGWYDPFCELIQNALDAVEARAQLESAAKTTGYQPQISIRIDLDDNSLTVSDNGIGLDKEKFEQFLAPNFSFKSGKTRGHKGVGATYVAYGFNYMRVSTKSPGFVAAGRILQARDWLNSDATGGVNPKVEPDTSKELDAVFETFDRGVSITVRFDATTHPKMLSWLQAHDAETWQKVLYIKTGLGSVTPDENVRVQIAVKHKDKVTTVKRKGTAYPWLHKSAPKSASYKVITKFQDELYRKYGAGRKMPDKFSNLDFIYETWTADELKTLLGDSLDKEDIEIIEKFTPTTSVEFGSTAKHWSQFNESLGLRIKVLSSGIQLAANNMPQGETILVPLVRNIGRQHQVHFLIHFDNYTPDLGRKGFHRELTDFAKSVSRAIVDTHLSKVRNLLKANTGLPPDLSRELAIDDWKKEMVAHEGLRPLKLNSKHFFLPVERVSITSVPTREQDVIALFHQLIAGGVIRGLNMMSTNERFTYDGLFRIAFDLAPELYVYDADKNPLGVPEVNVKGLSGKVTSPRILEYKFSLDGLIEDFDNQDKNIKDVDLCIAWETGDLFKEKYGITSLLIPENVDQRPYHGVTHILTDLETGARHCDLIILGDLIDHLNDPVKTAEIQRDQFE